MSKTSAWPLALIYTALIVFASLFPFDGWRAQGIDPLVFLLAPLPPPYWTGFDIATNVVGYAPLGFLLVLAMLRSGWGRGAVLLATLVGMLLSLVMEFLQIYLPRRVPSNLDLLLNAAGTLAGALSAALLERLGAIDRWSDFKGRWFVQDASGAIVGTVQLITAMPDNQPHRADVAKMLVHRRARRQGIAQQLMAAVDDAARVERKTVLVLDTVTGGDAERLYERAGWQRVGVVPDYALMPDGALCGTTFFCKRV